jgi:iron complex transport system ATP-binding protein
MDISLLDGSFSYGERQIFSHVNLDVSQGEVFCILGANGCGKTTLLRCLSGSLHLKHGTVRLGTQELSVMNIQDIAKAIGFIYQEHEIPFPFSVLEVVQMGRAPHLKLIESPSPKDMEIAKEALHSVDMLHLEKKPYTQISGGERQLVLIARALAQQPKIILMDEPTSHLDFKNQTTVLQIINELAKRGITVLMTSHYPDHALLFSSKVALMKDGRFIKVGIPGDVMTDQTLGDVYGMEVSMISVNDPNTGRELKLAVPRLPKKTS